MFFFYHRFFDWMNLVWHFMLHQILSDCILYTFNNICSKYLFHLFTAFGLTAVIFIGRSSNVISCLSLNSFTKSNISILMYHLFRDTSRTFCINFHIALSPAFADIFSRPWLIFLYSTIRSSTYSFFTCSFRSVNGCKSIPVPFVIL